jgi:hypothetical protein
MNKITTLLYTSLIALTLTSLPSSYASAQNKDKKIITSEFANISSIDISMQEVKDEMTTPNLSSKPNILISVNGKDSVVKTFDENKKLKTSEIYSRINRQLQHKKTITRDSNNNIAQYVTEEGVPSDSGFFFKDANWPGQKEFARITTMLINNYKTNSEGKIESAKYSNGYGTLLDEVNITYDEKGKLIQEEITTKQYNTKKQITYTYTRNKIIKTITDCYSKQTFECNYKLNSTWTKTSETPIKIK